MEQHSKLFIKGMVCNRCVMMVHDVLNKMGQHSVYIGLGEILLPKSVANLDKIQLQERLALHGFSLLEDGKLKIVNELRDLVAEVYSGNFDFPEKFRFSTLVKTRLNKEYDIVRDIFIAIEQQTLEQFIIKIRINKVKELLVYSTLKLADIAYKLNFNSVSHLSAQFKAQTGLTPSFFKGVKKQKADVISSDI